MKAFLTTFFWGVLFQLNSQSQFYNNNLIPLPDGNGVIYESIINVSGLSGDTISEQDDLSLLNVNIEHSYLGDLEIALQCPNGNEISILNSYSPGFIPGGTTGSSTFLGDPVDNVTGNQGIGWNYYFSSTFNTWGDYPTELANQNFIPSTINGNGGNSLNPLGVYLPEESFDNFVGCPLNGDWKIRIQDNIGFDDGYLFGWGIDFNLDRIGHSGRIFNDLNENCNLEIQQENGVEGVTLQINPGNYITQTNTLGAWHIDSLPVGTYTITVDTTSWRQTCLEPVTFTVDHIDSSAQIQPIGVKNLSACIAPHVSINSTETRPCMASSVYIQVKNKHHASDIISNSYVDIELDNLLSVTGASEVYTELANNTFRFNINELYPNQQKVIQIQTSVSCNATLDQSFCNTATFGPIQDCFLDSTHNENPTFQLNGFPESCTLPWDNSSLSVEGWCQGDSVVFEVTNTGEAGNGDMDCYSPIWMYQDTTIVFTDSITLAGGESQTFRFLATGQTMIFNAGQHPLHPGNSNPNAHVEFCGDSSNWTSGVVISHPTDDIDDHIDIDCRVVTGSYDPNDKQGFPFGLTEEHHITPGQDLEYKIRFQNTGTDTAFTVVIVDTLDTQLNIFSVTSGVSSHDYIFTKETGNVLKWTFNNILLPDSTTNLEGSQGFVTFKVDQAPNLPLGSVIRNDADIYFDFNAPVTTNETWHTIHLPSFESTASVNDIQKGADFTLFPNPTNSSVFLITTADYTGKNYRIFDQVGKIQLKGTLTGTKTNINLDKLKAGFYFVQIDGGKNGVKLIKR